MPLSNGLAKGSWVGFPGGTYNVYADYGGDANYGGSVSAPIQITVAPEDSVLALSVTAADASGNVSSLAGKTVTYGTYISVDAQPIGKSQVSNANPLNNATGTVTFDDSNSIGAQGSGMLDATGNAEFPQHSLGAGTHTITASYWGDNSYNASTSASVTFTVQKAGTITSVTSNVNSIYSGVVTVTAGIRPSAGGVAQLPNGTVTFTDKTSGAVLGTSALTTTRGPSTGTYFSAGIMNVPVSQLTLGNNSIVATYDGDANFMASGASAPVVVACTAGCGNGTGETLELSFGTGTPAAAQSPAGSTSTTAVLVSAQGGFTGAVNLTCSVTGTSGGDVKHSEVQLQSRRSHDPTNSQSVQSTLTVTTTAAGTTAAADASASHVWSAVRGGAMLACLLCFGLPGRRRALTMLSIVVCGLALGGMVACGGGATNGSAPPATSGDAATGTTPDKYIVTVRAVDAASGTLTAQDSFTVTVN